MQSSKPISKSRLADRAAGFWSRLSQKASVALVAGAGILAQPNVPLHLPGHRALVWIMLLLAVRMLNGAGWSSAVGVAATGAALLTGAASQTVAAYAIAGVLIDIALLAAPTIPASLLRVVALGVVVSLAVGWIAPFNQGQLDGSATMFQMFGYFAAFGAGAGLLAWALVSLGLRRRPSALATRIGMIGAIGSSA